MEDTGASTYAELLTNALTPCGPETNVAVVKLKDQINLAVDYAEKRIVANADDVKEATKDLGLIAQLKKGLEAERISYTGPLGALTSQINAFFKTLSDPIGQADTITRQKVLAYNAEVERKRQAAQRIEDEKLRLAQEEMELSGETTVNLAPVEAPAPTPRLVSTAYGTSGKTQVWKYEVVDFSKVPDEYKTIDNSMVNAVAKKHHDTKPIPGIRFYAEESLRVTT